MLLTLPSIDTKQQLQMSSGKSSISCLNEEMKYCDLELSWRMRLTMRYRQIGSRAASISSRTQKGAGSHFWRAIRMQKASTLFWPPENYDHLLVTSLPAEKDTMMVMEFLILVNPLSFSWFFLSRTSDLPLVTAAKICWNSSWNFLKTWFVKISFSFSQSSIRLCTLAQVSSISLKVPLFSASSFLQTSIFVKNIFSLAVQQCFAFLLFDIWLKLMLKELDFSQISQRVRSTLPISCNFQLQQAICSVSREMWPIASQSWSCWEEIYSQSWKICLSSSFTLFCRSYSSFSSFCLYSFSPTYQISKFLLNSSSRLICVTFSLSYSSSLAKLVSLRYASYYSSLF